MPDIIKSASMTADWENALSLMAQGKFTSQQFMVDIEKLVDDIIAVAKESVDESKVSRNGAQSRTPSSSDGFPLALPLI